ncbi:hypothetical protein HDU76_006171, partial [Blyttiomyces sp. JEL0837]
MESWGELNISPNVSTNGTNIILSSKYQTNITLALFWNYAFSSPRFMIELRDLICELAVNETNQNPDILPHTYVNILRVNSWDPSDSDGISIDSGGYTSVAAIDAVAQNGERFGNTASFSGQIFSYYKIPFCTADSFNPVLSNKLRYPYLFRLQNVGFGVHILQLLRYWNVKKIALVFGPETSYSLVAKEVEQTMKDGDITILAKIALSRDIIKVEDYELYYKYLINVDASSHSITRLCLDPDVTSGFYYKSSPNHVTIGYNFPVPWSGELTYEQVDLMQGFVYPNTDPPDVQSDVNMKFLDSYRKIYEQHPNASIPDSSHVSFYQIGAYDCVKVLMEGIHQNLDVNAFVPLLLMMTGYHGIVYDPINLDKNGDLAV